VLCNHTWIDVRPHLLSGEQPVFMMQRPLAHGHSAKGGLFNTAEIAKVGEHWVPHGPVLDVEDVQWGITKVGDLVRVPVFAYKTQHLAPASIWGLGLQIGLAAVVHLRKHTTDIPRAAMLVLGHECMDLRPAEEAYRCFVGIALQTK